MIDSMYRSTYTRILKFFRVKFERQDPFGVDIHDEQLFAF